ncbi:PfkB family carbohydrate kinase [Micromonospora sp. NPDC049523]|uniref:PfkB family carbohydrate kinase n=1 Tax=Micromonospora sp. NPDC049523 TaxID=3155921 RepID=UPI003442D03E
MFRVVGKAGRPTRRAPDAVSTAPTAGGSYRPTSAAVVDPTGSGETFAGALAAARLDGMDWLTAARYTTASASIDVDAWSSDGGP